MPWDERDDRKKAERVNASKALADERHEGFDLSAQDNHSKFERPHFAVIGEGTRTSQEAYRIGWERTFGKNLQDNPGSEGLGSSLPGKES
jgi:hypothetical protein